MEGSSKLRATSHYLYSPNRDTSLRCNLKGLNQCYSVSLSEDGLILRAHSRHGDGTLLAKKAIDESISIFNDNDDGDSREKKLEDGETPPAPKYHLYRATERHDVNVLKNSDVSYLEKKENGLNDRVSKNNQKLVYENTKILAMQKNRGLFPCSACNDQLQLCKKVYMKKDGLDQHEERAKLDYTKHTFPNLNTKTKIFKQAVSESGVMSQAKFRNRSKAVINRDMDLQLVLESDLDERDWFQSGCYNKPKRKPIIRTSTALHSDLIKMFEDGLKTNSKFSATEALSKLSKMKNDDGRLKYSHHPDNVNGPLPDEGKIKSFFCREANKRSKPITEKDVYASMKNVDIIEKLRLENCPIKPRTPFFYERMLTMHDKLNFEEEVVEYATWSVEQLEHELIHREFDISKPKSQLIAMAKLSDAYRELMTNAADADAGVLITMN